MKLKKNPWMGKTNQSVDFNESIYDHYANLVQLRMNSEALKKGDLNVLKLVTGKWL